MVRSLAVAMRSRPFRPLLAAYVFGSVALTLNASLALFYYQHRLQLGEREVFLWIFLPFALVIALSIGGWVLVARRFGRRWTAFGGVLLLGLGTAVVYPVFPAGELLGPVIWGIVGGALVGSVFLLDATVADVVDHDEVLTGTHREGLYFGVWRMASKMARALGLVVSGLLLDFIGFVPGAAVQSRSTATGLAAAFGPVVGGLFVIAALVWLCVPIDETSQARVRRILDRRQ
jgi:GPH family glycoside/pentoside/hexuronide:cation symporter